MTREEWLACPPAQQLTSIAYVSRGMFSKMIPFGRSAFLLPPNPEKDAFAIVINEQTEAFLPHIVKHFIDLRKHHQGQYKQTKDVYHYNAQLCIKILINSLYGVMANKDSCLAYLPIAMTIVTLARYQLLGSYHYLKRLNYHICYADTDSLMVQNWPDNDCHAVNAYLNLNHVELKFEQRMKRLLVLSRKRYIYETQKGTIVTKGFQKRINELIEFISQLVLGKTWDFFFSHPLKEGFVCVDGRPFIFVQSWMDFMGLHYSRGALQVPRC
ncbi:DNA polymerase [Trichonephila inaurata madagascariensis]|uniref:DNA-directed DNA polymerase n=1 Tax=Trichonephila inaurata madagascariensis TaxID=2747483 RepID=A0A8X6XZR3_9ARAC|nr:DNA polymerase [Trichonephila inaurata madagascariensis]